MPIVKPDIMMTNTSIDARGLTGRRLKIIICEQQLTVKIEATDYRHVQYIFSSLLISLCERDCSRQKEEV